MSNEFNFDVFNTKKASDDGATLHIVHPITGEEVYIDGDKKKKPITITMRGNQSTIGKNNLEKRINERNRAQAKNKNGKDFEEFNYSKSEQTASEDLAKLVVSWSNIFHDGKELECTAQNAQMLFMVYEEIRIQCLKFADEKENFVKG